MDSKNKLLLSSYDRTLRSINFCPINSNLGDTDSADIPDFQFNASDQEEGQRNILPFFSPKYPLDDPKTSITEFNSKPKTIGRSKTVHTTITDRYLQPLKKGKPLKTIENELNCSTFMPKINKTSLNLAVNRSFKDLLLDNLRRKRPQIIQDGADSPEKKPKINKKSLEIFRNSQHSHFPLYERLSMQRSVEAKENNTIQKWQLNDSSIEKAACFFRREFDSIIPSLMKNDGKEFNEEQVETILLNLGFLTPDYKSEPKLNVKQFKKGKKPKSQSFLLKEMWMILNKNQKRFFYVTKKKLFTFLMCVMGLDYKKTRKILDKSSTKQKKNIPINNNVAYQLSKDDEKPFEWEQNERNFLEITTEDDMCRFKTLETLKSFQDTSPVVELMDKANHKNLSYLSNRMKSPKIKEDFLLDFKEISRKFQTFYRNRLMSQKERTYKSDIQELRFEPQILNISREIAFKAREKIRGISSLNNSDLFGIYEAQKRAKRNSCFLNKTNETLIECPFKPKRISHNSRESFEANKRQSLNKLAEPKLKIPARKTDEIFFDKFKKEYTFKPNTLKSKASNSAKSQWPSSLMKKKSENVMKSQNKEDMIEINVMVKKGQMEKIVLFKNSDINHEVKKFVTTHSFFLIL